MTNTWETWDVYENIVYNITMKFDIYSIHTDTQYTKVCKVIGIDLKCFAQTCVTATYFEAYIWWYFTLLHKCDIDTHHIWFTFMNEIYNLYNQWMADLVNQDVAIAECSQQPLRWGGFATFGSERQTTLRTQPAVAEARFWKLAHLKHWNWWRKTILQ